MIYPKKIVNHYIDEVKKDIKLDGVLLFGSFAYGKPNKHSDVDLAVISRDFKKMNFLKRMDWLQSKRGKPAFQIAMDIIGYTPEEFKKIEESSATMAYAKKHGKWIYKK